MLDDIPQIDEIDFVLDDLSSPTSLEVFEALLPYEDEMSTAAIGAIALAGGGGGGGPPTGAAGGVLGGTYPNPSFASDMATQAELDAHVNDAADAHDASAISIADAGSDFTATDVEGALAELQADHEADATGLSDHIADTSAAHAASAIAFTPQGSIAATNVQAAIQEVRDEATGGGIAATLFDANTILKADTDDTPAALTMGASTTLARLAAGSIVAATPTEMRTMLDVPSTGEAVLDSLYDANTVLKADSDNTPAALTMGASTVLARLAAGNIVAATVAQMGTMLAPAMPGYELAYAQITANATTTQTVRASATTWLTAPSVTFDGSTAVWIEAGFVAIGNSTTAATVVSLWEDSTDLCNIMYHQLPNGGAGFLPATNKIKITPSAGAKVYTVRAYVIGASTGTGYAGTLTGVGNGPAFIRIIRV